MLHKLPSLKLSAIALQNALKYCCSTKCGEQHLKTVSITQLNDSPNPKEITNVAFQGIFIVRGQIEEKFVFDFFLFKEG